MILAGCCLYVWHHRHRMDATTLDEDEGEHTRLYTRYDNVRRGCHDRFSIDFESSRSQSVVVH